MTNALAVELEALSVHTSSGTGSAVDIEAIRTAAVLTLEVTAASGGNTTLDVTLEASTDGSANWVEVGAFEQVNAAGYWQVTFAGLQRYIRARWTLSGTSPSFTFGVAGDAHVVYATPTDFSRLALPAKAYSSVADSVLADGLLAATSEADGYVNSAFTLPLTQWGEALRMHCAWLAAYAVMNHKGYSPEPGSDERIRLGREDAIDWLKRLADGRLMPPDIIDSTPDVSEGGVFISSGPSRGWEDWG